MRGRRHWIVSSAACVIAAGGLPACTSPQTVVVWEKPGASPAELEAARAACRQESGVQDVRTGRGRTEAELRASSFVRCLEQKGWTWSTELQEP